MSWSYIGTMVFVYEISDLSWICSYWNISFGLKNLDFAGKRLRRYKTHHIFSWYCRILGVGVKSRERRFVLAALVVWVVALANIVTLCFFGRLLSIMWKLLELRGPLEKWTLKLINYENFQYLYSNHRHNLVFTVTKLLLQMFLSDWFQAAAAVRPHTRSPTLPPRQSETRSIAWWIVSQFTPIFSVLHILHFVLCILVCKLCCNVDCFLGELVRWFVAVSSGRSKRFLMTGHWIQWVLDVRLLSILQCLCWYSRHPKQTFCNFNLQVTWVFKHWFFFCIFWVLSPIDIPVCVWKVGSKAVLSLEDSAAVRTSESFCETTRHVAFQVGAVAKFLTTFLTDKLWLCTVTWLRFDSSIVLKVMPQVLQGTSSMSFLCMYSLWSLRLALLA